MIEEFLCQCSWFRRDIFRVKNARHRLCYLRRISYINSTATLVTRFCHELVNKKMASDPPCLILYNLY